MRVLVTRPQADAARTAARLQTLGHESIVAPLTRVEATGASIGQGPFAAVVLTSANAARALAQHPRCADLIARSAYVVGEATAEAARQVGFSDVTSADGDAGDLAAVLRAGFGKASPPLLYLAGEERARDLVAELAGIPLVTVEIYRMVASPTLPPDIVAALDAGTLDAVLHYSRRAAETFLACATAAKRTETALAPLQACFSVRTAEPLRQAGASRIAVAEHPDEDALFALLAP